MPPLTESQTAVFVYAHSPDAHCTDRIFMINSPNGFSHHIYASENKGVIDRHSGIASGSAIMV